MSRCKLCVLLLCAVGCGQSNPLNRQAIQGTVTLDGAPVVHGSVDFQPMQQGGVSSGAVIKDGQFTIKAPQGLPPGKYRVAIYASDPTVGVLPEGGMPGDEVAVPEELIPADWNVNSKQTIEVTSSGVQKFPFDIKTK